MGGVAACDAVEILPGSMSWVSPQYNALKSEDAANRPTPQPRSSDGNSQNRDRISWTDP